MNIVHQRRDPARGTRVELMWVSVDEAGRPVASTDIIWPDSQAGGVFRVERFLPSGAEPLRCTITFFAADDTKTLEISGTEVRVLFDAERRGLDPDIIPAYDSGGGSRGATQPRPLPRWEVVAGGSAASRSVYLWLKVPCLLLPLHRTSSAGARSGHTHVAWCAVSLGFQKGRPVLTRLGLAAGSDTKPIPLVKREQWWIFDTPRSVFVEHAFLDQALPSSVLGRADRPSARYYSSVARTVSLGVPRRPSTALVSMVEVLFGLSGNVGAAPPADEGDQPARDSAALEGDDLAACWDDRGDRCRRLTFRRRFHATAGTMEPFLRGTVMSAGSGDPRRSSPLLVEQVAISPAQCTYASTDLKPIFFQRFETHGSSRGFSS